MTDFVRGACQAASTKRITCTPVAEPGTGVTVDQASVLLCDPTEYPSIFGATSGQGSVGWGESGEVSVLYNLSDGKITDILLTQGYAGTLSAACAPGASVASAVGACATATTYTVSMNNVFMTKAVGGAAPQNIVLDWGSPTSIHTITNQLYEALRQTFIPSLAGDMDCVAAGDCEIDDNGPDHGVLLFKPLNPAIFVSETIGTPAQNSVPIIIDLEATSP